MDRYEKWTSKNGTPFITLVQVGNSESKFDDGTPVFKDGEPYCSVEFTSVEERETWLLKYFKQQVRTEEINSIEQILV